ncbi:MAG: hypothetical protein MUC85_00240 [Anaerolineales bacterium]|jgi:hypothetical protein|nr:hypothetical protein [Anaerolineales bacterium]
MPLPIHLKIDAKQIHLEDPEGGIRIRLENQVAYDTRRLTLISYGKSADQLKAEMGADWQDFSRNTAFVRIFDPKTIGPVFDYQVIDLLFHRLFQQIPSGNPGLLKKMSKPSLEIKAEIQDYERLSLGRRRELEYHLQDFQGAQRLWINGEERTIPLKWRTLQAWSGWVLRLLLPMLLLFGGLLTIFTQPKQQAVQLLLTAAGWITVSVLTFFLGTILWILIFRKKLPSGYLRYQLRSSGAILRRPTRWLAEKLL